MEEHETVKCRIKGCDHEADVADFCKTHYKQLDAMYMEDGRSVLKWLLTDVKAVARGLEAKKD
jgi:hypothetical protein